MVQLILSVAVFCWHNFVRCNIATDSYCSPLPYMGIQLETVIVHYWHMGYIVTKIYCPLLAYGVHIYKQLLFANDTWGIYSYKQLLFTTGTCPWGYSYKLMAHGGRIYSYCSQLAHREYSYKQCKPTVHFIKAQL